MDDVGLPFGPGTMSRDVLRRPVFFVGGMNALLLQLAEPKVAAGVADHSDFADRIFDRLQHTVAVMVEVGLGDPAEAERALRRMDRAHEGVRGALPDGSTYDAEDPDLRWWVLATLIATVLAVEEAYVGEFDHEDRRRYYHESLEMARVFGVEDAPSDLDGFHSYMSDRITRLEVTDTARQVADHVLHPRMGRIPSFVFAPLRLVTADLLPARLRDAYGIHLSPPQRRWLERAQASSRAVIPMLPDRVRTYPLLRPPSGVPDRKLHRHSR